MNVMNDIIAAFNTPAVREITVSVTQENIDKGRPSDCSRCPVAMAILDAIPGAASVEVWWSDGDPGEPSEHGACARIWLARGVLTHRLGTVADRFIRDFDFREPVGPFTFTMTIPEEAS